MSEAMVRYAGEHSSPDRFQLGDIERLPFPDNSCDGVTCLGVMEYLSSDELALREMRRVLKPDGRAVITTPSSICPFYYMDRTVGKLRLMVRPLVRFIRYLRHGRLMASSDVEPVVAHRRYYRGSWQKLLKSMGFEV